MTTTCGHDRDVLLWALRLAIAMPRTAQKSFRPYDPTPDELARMRAIDDVHDPAKLAAMLAHEGRRLGFSAWHGPNEPLPPQSNQLVIYEYVDAVRVYLPDDVDADHPFQLSMSQAHAILLQWLNLPNGAHKEALRFLRGAS